MHDNDHYDEVERRRCQRGRGFQQPTTSALVPSSSSSFSLRSVGSHPSVSSSGNASSLSWKARCKRTGEYCAAGHELIQIPVLDRQRYLQRQERLIQLQEEQELFLQGHHHEEPASGIDPVSPSLGSTAPIIIECDCCSMIMDTDDFIAGCCLECDIDVCKNCFKKGQSYIDVVLRESREKDTSDENLQQRQRQQLQGQRQQVYRHHNDRYNGHRPSYIGTGRVNYDDYPDPTVFQWAFTGSSNPNDSVAPIEYFEKDYGKEVGVVRLDFYYTIGTVHTFLVDPIDGSVHELFTRSQMKMSQQSFRKILKDPRMYTNERYKKGTLLAGGQRPHQVL